jgi:hypothetical protein
VVQAFGILQSRWVIFWYPAKKWSVQKMWEIMTACKIMHNMIIEEERNDSVYDQGWAFQGELVSPNPGPTLF